MRTLSIIAAGFVSLACDAGSDYEQPIRKLAAGTPSEEADAALQELEAAGRDAFPALIAHFADRSPASNRFQRAQIEQAPDGTYHARRPTIGDVCFDILQGRIEGNWPVSFRTLYVLNRTNAQKWLDAHKMLSLRELRIAAAREALRRAETGKAERPALEFLRKRLEEIQQ